MRRALPLLTLLLAVLVLVDLVVRRLGGRHREAPPPATERATLSGSADPAPVPAADEGEARRRAETRAVLAVESGETYLDSLLLTTDSVLRRWPDRPGTPLRVAFVAYQAERDPLLTAMVRDGLLRWQEALPGVRFDVVPDTTGADVVVRWIPRFTIDRAGQTDLTWDRRGAVRRALVTLALESHTGQPLPDGALRAVATHEIGHALGLPHSADSLDVMFPQTRTERLSWRDRRSASVLYRLRPGSVK